MNKYVSDNQFMAIRMVEKLTTEVVDVPSTRKSFCNEVRKQILGKEGIDVSPYREVLSATLKGEIDGKGISNYTLRNTVWTILKVLTEEGDFTPEERKEIGQKVMQGGGKRGLMALKALQLVKALTEEERDVLEKIFKSNDSEYKRGTTRNIKKIMEKLEGESGIHRDSESIVKKYLQNLSTAPKKEANLRNDPEEIQTLKDLFIEYYNPSRKLPTKIIMQRLNEKHGRNRNENSVEGFIRTHIKTEKQKQKLDGIWSDEEKAPLLYFVDKKEEYRIKKGKRAGNVNRELIHQEYKKMYPEAKRTKRALEHKLKDLWEKNKK